MVAVRKFKRLKQSQLLSLLFMKNDLVELETIIDYLHVISRNIYTNCSIFILYLQNLIRCENATFRHGQNGERFKLFGQTVPGEQL